MAYDHKQELLRARLLTITGASYASKTIPEIWDAYLTAVGITGGTLLDRQAKMATYAGMPLTKYLEDGGGLGPELSITAASGLWSLGANQTQDGAGIHFTAAANTSLCSANSTDTANNALYRATVTSANHAGGSFRLLLYGDTTPYVGASSPNISAAGDYSYNILTAFGAGSSNNTFRIQATGTTGTNTYDITAISLKRIL